MAYRITSTSPDGTSKATSADAEEALRLAREAEDEGRDEVWIADDEGRLFTAREFERLLNRYD
jgi:hypothetical protein